MTGRDKVATEEQSENGSSQSILNERSCKTLRNSAFKVAIQVMGKNLPVNKDPMTVPVGTKQNANGQANGT